MLIQEEMQRTEPAAVREQLQKIIRSGPFIRSARIGEFLTFVVENMLDGNINVLKETCIGSMVFGREAAYDPKIDPIVRVEARRLRQKLQEYYENEGVADALVFALPKGGYRPTFESRSVDAATPFEIEQDANAVAVPVETSHEIQSIRKNAVSRWVFVAGIVLLAAAGFGAWRLLHTSRQDGDLRFFPLTSEVGQEFQPAVSPDGRHLAFVWNGDGSNYDIYVKSVPSGDAVRISSGPGHHLHPAWSPDGRDIAALDMTPEHTQVVVVPSSGGAEHAVGEIRSNVTIWKADASQISGSLGPAWSPDGRSLVVSNGGALTLWPVGYGDRRKLTSPPNGSTDFAPAVSPDGKSVVFVRQTSNSVADLYRVQTDKPNDEPQRLTWDRADIRGVVWSPDGRSLIFSSARQDGHALWKLALADTHLERLTMTSTEAVEPSLASSGNLLAFTQLEQNTNIWRMPVGGQTAAPVRLIASSHRNDSAQYSPDGARIAFISDRTGHWELWTAHADGSATHQLTNFRGAMLGTPHWSPDSRSIAFDARPAEHSAIFVIPSDGGAPRQISNGAFEERMPNWSHDGRWIYLNSNRSGSVRLWKMGLHGETPTAITTRPAYDSFESQDGETIYFRSDTPGIWSVPAGGGTEALIPELGTVDQSRYFTVGRHGIYFVDHESVPRRVQFYDFATHRVRTLGEIERSLVSGTPSLSISPDEHSLLFAQQDYSSSDITGVAPGSLF